MDYSIEEIFFFAGQYDKVVNISFKYNSESFHIYGDHITGEFIYTPSERDALQKIIGENNFPKTDGYARFKSLLSEVPEEQKELLITKGVRVSDISSILQFGKNPNNSYTSTDTRSLPKPLEIKVNLSDVDNDLLTINTYSRMEENGYKLIPYEKSQLNAALLNKYGNRIKEEVYNDLFVDSNTGQLNEEIRFYQLERKYLSKEGLTTEENEEFMNLLKLQTKVNAQIILKELEKSTENFKKIGFEYPQIFRITSILASGFKPERLLMCKFPVWWDFERFLHIYLRHVREVQVGDRFVKKTQFQYALKDIKRLIEIVLRQIQQEIENHFSKTPEKDFKRQGSMCIYYNGDYYAIHIATDGRLMTFYKSSQNEV